MDFIRTDDANKDFIENCRFLDMDLDRRAGKKIKRDKYQKFNQLDEIHEAIVVYEDNRAVKEKLIFYYIYLKNRL